MIFDPLMLVLARVPRPAVTPALQPRNQHTIVAPGGSERTGRQRAYCRAVEAVPQHSCACRNSPATRCTAIHTASSKVDIGPQGFASGSQGFRVGVLAEVKLEWP